MRREREERGDDARKKRARETRKIRMEIRIKERYMKRERVYNMRVKEIRKNSMGCRGRGSWIDE